MRQHEGKCKASDDNNGRQEASEIQHCGPGALDEVIGIGAPAAYPVGDGGYHVGRDDEQRVIHLPQRAGEDDEEEADGEDEGEGDDGLEAGGRHGDGLAGVAPGEEGVGRAKSNLCFWLKLRCAGNRSSGMEFEKARKRTLGR